MRLTRCERRTCGAALPAGASFCPRCGRANIPAPGAPRRPRRVWPRVALGVILAVILMKGVFRAAVLPVGTNLVAPVPASPPADIEDTAAFEARVESALGSLEAFAVAREAQVEAGQGRRRFSDYVAGRHVRWIGRFRHTLRPGTYRLIADPDHPNAAVRLVPASPEVKQVAKQIVVGSEVEVEGVLMDDQSLHVTLVRVVER